MSKSWKTTNLKTCVVEKKKRYEKARELSSAMPEASSELNCILCQTPSQQKCKSVW
jgi:hypothetical protein